MLSIHGYRFHFPSTMLSQGDMDAILNLNKKEYRAWLSTLSPDVRRTTQKLVRKQRNLLQARKSREQKRLQYDFLVKFYHNTRVILEEKTLDMAQKLHYLNTMYDVEEEHVALEFLNEFSDSVGCEMMHV